MDYSNNFKTAARLIWRNKRLWPLGLLLVSSSIPLLIANHYYLRFSLSFPLQMFEQSGPGQPLPTALTDLFLNPTILLGGTAAIFLIFVIVWILSTIGEAALIRGIADTQAGNSHSLRQMLSIGVSLLGRFIAIDTVIFLPLFLILLIQLLTIGGGLIAGITYLTQPGSDPGNLLPVGIIVGLLLLFLSILIIPVTIVTAMIRLFAFRSAVLEDLPTRPSIRRAWQLIRAKIGQIIVVFLLLYAVSYGIGILSSILILPFSIGGMMLFLRPIMQGQLPPQSSIDAFILLISFVSAINILPGLLYRVFYSAVWTLSYREWQSQS